MRHGKWLTGFALCVCGARAGLSLLLANSNQWPFVPYNMYSDHRTSRLENGVLIPAARDGTGKLCRLPDSDFGSKGRLDLTGFYARGEPAPLFQELRRTCAAGLGRGPVCGSAQFWLVRAAITGRDSWEASLAEVTKERIREDIGKQLVSNLESLFLGAGCRPDR